MFKKLLFALASASLLAPVAQAGVIIVDPDVNTSLANTIWTGNVAGDRTTLVSGQITPNTAIPLAWSLASNPTANHANATFLFGNNGFFISNIDNARTGATAAQQHARIAFMVDVETTFTFSGQYTNSNFADSSGRAFLQNQLFERGGSSSPIPFTTVFSTSFAAGPVPLNIATVTGTLQVGRTYVWDVFVGSLASGNPAGSVGSGNLSLTFAAVPEPSSLVLGLMGMAGVGFVRRRRK